MDIAGLKQHMMDELGLTEDQVAHVNEELLIEYLFADSQDDDFQPDTPVAEGDEAASYARYGHDLVFKSGKVEYRRGDAGTPNYECGRDIWVWRSKQGDKFEPQGRKCHGKDVYMLKRP